ncbi:MAG: type II toxin-antitoxin system PemK/MazF family toxin [Verrucomicrobiota bacterium]
MKRGEVYWVNFDPQVGGEIKKLRPVVVVGHDVINDHRRTVVVVPLSSAHTKTHWPVMVATHSTGPACAIIDQIKACDKSRLQKKLGELSAMEMQEISEALRYTLGL